MPTRKLMKCFAGKGLGEIVFPKGDEKHINPDK
jgi:hypothetical protein